MKLFSRKILIVAGVLLSHPDAVGQYTTYGKIEYERKVNLIRQIEDMTTEENKIWMDKMKSSAPKFTTSYFDLQFNGDASIYKPGRESEQTTKMMWMNPPAAENVVFTDLKNNHVAAAKLIFEERFLVEDSLRKLEWKIMDEIRVIADYKCRKAVSRICDSVYVVAFYTEDIPASGGPEMFGGLPGMIMQIAVPRLHTTWIATKVDIIPPRPEDLKKPSKGKKVNQEELYTNLNKSISKWGNWAHRTIWWSML